MDKTKLSCLVRVGGVNTIKDKTVSGVQIATVQSKIYSGLLKTWKLETGWSRQDKTVLSPIVFTAPTRTRQNSLVMSVSMVRTSY